MKKICIVSTMLIWVLCTHSQKYISLTDGSYITTPDEKSYTRDVELLDDGVLVTYNLGYARIGDDLIYPESKMIQMNGFGANNTAGEPAVLGRTDSFTIPDGATPTVSVVESRYVDIPLRLSPARPPLSEKSYEMYSKDNVPQIKPYTGLFPQSIIESLKTQLYRGTTIASFVIKPVQYNYETSTVRVFSKIVYKVNFEGGSNYTSLKRISPDDHFLKNTTLNQGFFDASSKQSDRSGINVTKDYLIITVPQFLEAVNRFAEWKRLMGYNVIISVQSSWTYDDAKAEVQSQYDTCGYLYYYLLVGSHSLINSKYAGSNYYTDYYMGCMDGEYDLIADVCGGRLPVTTLNEANTVVDKIINYERYPVMDNNFYNTGVNCTCFTDSNYDGYEDRRYALTTERIRDYVTSKGKNVIRVYHANSTVTPTNWIDDADYYSIGDTIPYYLKKPNFAWDGDADDIVNYINQGAFYVLHRDHGNVEGWVDPEFDLTDIHQLNNGNKLPVVFSINCVTGRFYDSSHRCFADSILIMNNGGAVGVFASTEYSWPHPNDALAEGLFEAMWPSPGLMQDFGCQIVPSDSVYALGEILREGVSKMMTVNAWEHHKSNTKEYYHCFGDPSMEIRTMYPTSFGFYTLIRNTNNIVVNLGSVTARITFFDALTGMVTSYWGNSVTHICNPDYTTVCIYAHNKIPSVSSAPISINFIQNETVTGNITISADVNKAGNTKPTEPVTFNNGEINLNGGTVEIEGETTVTLGTTLNINNQ